MRTFNLVRVALASAALAPAAVIAQQVRDSAAPTLGESVLDVVIVTAQRREQSLEEVPMSLTVVSEQVLDTQRATTVEALAQFVPNFQSAGLTAQQPQLTIRGIGTTDRQAGSDQSVVVFVDEQYVGRSSATTFSLLDVARVEVLRGPQGTLFGRNASGGAISIVNNRPTSEFSGSASVGFGNRGLLESRGVLNVPVSSDTALRFAALGRKRDGYYHNVFVGDRAGDRDSWAGRATVQFRPGPFTALVTLEAYRDTIDGLSTKLRRGENVSDADYAAAVGTFNIAANPYIFPTSRPFDVAGNVLGESEADGAAVRGRLEWTGDVIEATVHAGYRDNTLDESYDAVGIPIVGTGPASRGFNSTQITEESYEAYSLEGRLQSADSDAPLQWIVGANYLRDDVARDVALLRQSNNSFSKPLFVQDVTTDSYAAFGEVSWKFAPRFELVVGGRYTIDEKDFDLDVINALTPAEAAAIGAALGRPPTMAPATAPFTAATREEWSRFTPRGALRFKLSEGASLYALWSRGYKGGGFFGTPANAVAAVTGFDPETVDNREVGLRSRFAQGRIRFNLSAFDMKFRDLQIQDRFFLVPGNPASLVNQVTNAAGAKIQGIEADFALRPLAGLTVSGSVGLLDTEISRVNVGSNLLVGAPLPKSPESSLNLAVEYGIKVAASGSLTLRGSWHREGDNYLDINRRAAGFQPAYSILDASALLEFGQWSFTLWGKNLGDELYLNVANLFPNGAAGPVQYGEPRSYGMTAAWRF